jgi:hypothetical protein
MRILRSVWVVVTNGTVIFFMYLNTQPVADLNRLLEQPNKNRFLWFHFVLSASIPVLGILLEFLGSRFAKWVNLGFFLLVGLLFSYIGIWNWSDYVGRTYLFLALPAFGVAVANYFLYRKSDADLGILGLL